MGDQKSEVASFYNDGHILITGSTGFMGKVLVEKLLRTCQGISHLYLLIRVKKGKEPALRLKELFDDPLFEKLKNYDPNFLEKVTVVPGDCSSPGLGLSENDRRNLIENLTHVFHGAATVRFDEKIKLAIGVNVRGVKEMLTFCHACTKLKSVMHTSTAYAHCPRDSIREEFYDPPMSGENALKLIESLDADKLDLITPDLIKPWPNTYSFSKAIAENFAEKLGQGLPFGVFRPSIVVSTAQEPVPGWTDNFYGPTGVVAGAGVGLLRTLYADQSTFADLVPVDLAVNGLICAAKDVGESFAREKLAQSAIDSKESSNCGQKEILIFNYTASRDNPLTWGLFREYNIKHGLSTPSIQAIWHYVFTLTTCKFYYEYMKVFYHLLPALIFDAGLMIAGQKPKLWRAYEKIHKFSQVISYFSTKEWHFEKDNMLRLTHKLSAVDQELFPCDMNSVDWDSFFKGVTQGVRVYLLKEPWSTLPAARRKQFRFKVAHRLLQLALWSFYLWVIYSISSTILASSGSESISEKLPSKLLHISSQT